MAMQWKKTETNIGSESVEVLRKKSDSWISNVETPARQTSKKFAQDRTIHLQPSCSVLFRLASSERQRIALSYS